MSQQTDDVSIVLNFILLLVVAGFVVKLVMGRSDLCCVGATAVFGLVFTQNFLKRLAEQKQETKKEVKDKK